MLENPDPLVDPNPDPLVNLVDGAIRDALMETGSIDGYNYEYAVSVLVSKVVEAFQNA